MTKYSNKGIGMPAIDVTKIDYFGGCPECGGNDGMFNSGRDHWLFCGIHRTRWCIGSNLFSAWRYETEADWQANREKYGPYRDVKAVRPSLALVCEECLSRLRARAKEIGEGALIGRCEHYAKAYGMQRIHGRVNAGLLVEAEVVFDRSTVEEPAQSAFDGEEFPF